MRSRSRATGNRNADDRRGTARGDGHVAPRYRVGISGWRYARWRGVFYPTDLVQRRELEYASRQMDSIEINGSFYSLQRADAWQRWHDQTPDDFVFAVKCPRFISHIKRLRDIEAPLANFFASGALLLRRKLGPLLWQFPPNLAFDKKIWSAFLRLLPKTAAQAASLARKHDHRIRAAALPDVIARQRLRYAIEVRHESFHDEEFLTLLRRHDVALVTADTAGKYPDFDDVTADFLYLRLHGGEVLYSSGYSDADLKRWIRRIKKDAGTSRDVYCYFDNDAKVHAPFDAQRLRELLNR
jgi:uncharacterized protein YecE (DUF72 family)